MKKQKTNKPNRAIMEPVGESGYKYTSLAIKYINQELKKDPDRPVSEIIDEMTSEMENENG